MGQNRGENQGCGKAQGRGEAHSPHFRDTGEVCLLPSALDVARRYVAANTGYLARNGIVAYVAGVGVNQALRQVEVTVVADVSSLFPRWVPRAVIRGRGVAEVRAGRPSS